MTALASAAHFITSAKSGPSFEIEDGAAAIMSVNRRCSSSGFIAGGGIPGIRIRANFAILCGSKCDLEDSANQSVIDLKWARYPIRYPAPQIDNKKSG